MYFFRTFKKSTAPYKVHNMGLRYIKTIIACTVGKKHVFLPTTTKKNLANVFLWVKAHSLRAQLGKKLVQTQILYRFYLIRERACYTVQCTFNSVCIPEEKVAWPVRR